MTGVRTMSSGWAVWTGGIALAVAAVWLTRVDIVLPPPAPSSRQATPPEASRCLGMRLEDAAQRSGLVVLEVASGSPAARAGVQPGDILMFVDDQLARSTRQVAEMLQGGRPACSLMLELVRAGNPLVLSVDFHNDQNPTMPVYRLH